MEIITIDIDKLTPDPHNAKEHPAWQVEQIKASIETFGNLGPIGVWGDNNLIVEGHGRYLALKELGYPTAECIRLDWLTEDERRAYALVHNKTTMNSGFDIDALTLNLDDIKGIDMTMFGFNTEPGSEPEPEIEEDEVPEEVETRCQPGNIWQLGEHRLMCGDSTKPEDVDKLMQDELADLVFTDPPYGVSYKGTNNPNGREWQIIKNDTLRGDELFLFLLEAFKNIKRKLKIGGAYYIWYANSNAVQFETALDGAELKKKQIIIWQKGMVLGHSDYHWTYEPCIYGCHPEQNCEWYGDRAQKTLWDLNPSEIAKMKKEEMQTLLERLYADKDVWEIKRDPVTEYVHPTQKPVALSAKALHNSSQPGNIVLDLFGGSGSTLIGCEQLGRKARLMEFDPHYCDVILQRWENLTNEKAVLLNETSEKKASRGNEKNKGSNRKD